MLNAFHIVKLASQAVGEVCRRIQQETLGHRGPKGDPLYGICNLLRAGRDRLTSRQQKRQTRAFAAHPDRIAVEVAYQCAQGLEMCSTSPQHRRDVGSPSGSSTRCRPA